MAWSLYGLPVSRAPLPWEVGIFAPLPGFPRFTLGTAPVLGLAPPAAPQTSKEDEAESRTPAEKKTGQRARAGDPPVAADTSARGRALQRWVDIAPTMKKKPPKGETWAS